MSCWNNCYNPCNTPCYNSCYNPGYNQCYQPCCNTMVINPGALTGILPSTNTLMINPSTSGWSGNIIGNGSSLSNNIYYTSNCYQSTVNLTFNLGSGHAIQTFNLNGTTTNVFHINTGTSTVKITAQLLLNNCCGQTKTYTLNITVS